MEKMGLNLNRLLLNTAAFDTTYIQVRANSGPNINQDISMTSLVQ